MYARTNAISLLICRGAIAFVWFYHGLFPKLLGPDADELAMDLALGVSQTEAVRIAYAAGVGEIAFSVCILLFWRSTWPLWATLFIMILLLGFIAIFTPHFLTAAFNPVTINISVMALSAVGLLLHREQALRAFDRHIQKEPSNE